MTLATGPAQKTCKGCGQTRDIEKFSYKSKVTLIRWAYCEDCLPAERRRKMERQRIHRAERRVVNGAPVDREPSTRLPAAQAVLWLGRMHWQLTRGMVAECESPLDVRATGATEALAEHFGTSPRQLYRLMEGQRRRYPNPNKQVTITLDMFDRWLCHAGTPWMLRELYPTLFRWDDPESRIYNMDSPLVDIPDDEGLEQMGMAA